MNTTRMPLGDALEALIDHRGKTPKKLGGDWSTAGHRVVSARNIKNSTIDDNEHRFISDELYRKWMKEELRAGDVILTSEAPTGEVAYLAENHKWALGQRVFGLRGKKDLLDGRFLYYALRGGDVRHELMSRTTGTTVQGIRQSELVKVEISLPEIGEQRAIAATLGALDDKIASNRRALTLLDELFRVLWLREYLSLPETSVVPLATKVATQYGLTARASDDIHGDKFLRVTDINKQNWINWWEVPSVVTDEKSRQKYGLRKGDVLVARMADPGKSAIYDEGPPSVFASYLVRLKTRSYPEALFIYGFLKSNEYWEYASGAMTGSVQKNMNARVIVGADLRWPDLNALSRFAKVAEPIRVKISQLVNENEQLSKLRDSLLPELLSGRIRVSANGAA